jgi:hypothetical protein
MFDTEMEAARAYDAALWRLKPREARNYANLKDTCPPDVSELLATLEKVSWGSGELCAQPLRALRHVLCWPVSHCCAVLIAPHTGLAAGHAPCRPAADGQAAD